MKDYSNVNWNEKKPFIIEGKTEDEIAYLNFEELFNLTRRIAANLIFRTFTDYKYLYKDLMQECAIKCMQFFSSDKLMPIYYLKRKYFGVIYCRVRRGQGYQYKLSEVENYISLDNKNFSENDGGDDLYNVLGYNDEFLNFSLSQLTDIERKICYLLYIGYYQTEISKKLNKPLSSINNYVINIRCKLSKQFDIEYKPPKKYKKAITSNGKRGRKKGSFKLTDAERKERHRQSIYKWRNKNRDAVNARRRELAKIKREQRLA